MRFRAVMSVEIGGGNSPPALHGRRRDRASGGRRRLHGPRLPRGADDELRDRRPDYVPAHPGRRPRQRGRSSRARPTCKWMERLSRKACVEVGSVAATCKAPRTGRKKSRSAASSTPRPRRSGSADRAGGAPAPQDPIAALVEAERGRLLFRGKVQDVARRTTEGFLRGPPVDGLDDSRRVVRARNSRTSSRSAGSTAGLGDDPDIICVLDSVSGEAIGTETLRYGQRVSVIALPAPPLLLTPKGLEPWARALSATTSTSDRCSREHYRNRRRRHQHRRRAARRHPGRTSRSRRRRPAT